MSIVDTWVKVHLATGALPGNSMFTWVSARIRIFMIEGDTEAGWETVRGKDATWLNEKSWGYVLRERHRSVARHGYDRRIEERSSTIVQWFSPSYSSLLANELFKYAHVLIDVDLILSLHRVGSSTDQSGELSRSCCVWRNSSSRLLLSCPFYFYY